MKDLGQEELDGAIDDVLHGLRDAEPAPGMEQRVIAAMERAGEAPAKAFVFPQLRWAAAGVAMATLLVVWCVRRGSQVESAPPLVAGHAVTQNVIGMEVLSQRPPSRTAVSPARPRHDATHKDMKDVALGPIVEPPMTHEEQVMQRLAVRSDPEVIAALRPEERAAPMEMVIEINRDAAVTISDVP